MRSIGVELCSGTIVPVGTVIVSFVVFGIVLEALIDIALGNHKANGLMCSGLILNSLDEKEHVNLLKMRLEVSAAVILIWTAVSHLEENGISKYLCSLVCPNL